MSWWRWGGSGQRKKLSLHEVVPRGGQESQPGAGLALLKADQGFLGKKGDHPGERREHESHHGGNRQGMEGWSVANT